MIDVAFSCLCCFYLRGFGFCSERQFASIRNGGVAQRGVSTELNGMAGLLGAGRELSARLLFGFLLLAFWGWVVY